MILQLLWLWLSFRQWLVTVVIEIEDLSRHILKTKISFVGLLVISLGQVICKSTTTIENR